jgi:NADPH-dependent 2,4-dienoyl-CoA reductase/sulfur reductase-like enzyme
MSRQLTMPLLYLVGTMKAMMTSGRTIWVDQLDAEEVSPLDPGLPEALERRPDVLVVGGGIIGVATAAACRDAGVGSVLL